MKRDDMVSILLNSIFSNMYNYGDDFDARAILKDLEDAGMLPNTFYDEDEGGYMSVDAVLDCGNLSGKFQWEAPDAI